MPRQSSLPTLIVLLTGLLLAALLPLLAAGVSASHDPLREVSTQIAGHIEFLGVAQDTANHEHDGDRVGDVHSGHQHAHSAIDHSHESLFSLPEHAIPFCTGTTSWRYCTGTGQTGTVVAVPERPPRSATA